MPRKREQLARQGWTGDDLAPINGDVLKVLLEQREWGPGQLARQVGRRYTNQQNISDILKSGRARRCRRSLRRRIAKVLEVPEEYLGNEPVVPPVGPMVWPGTEYQYSIRTRLAASRLLTLTANAVTRDLDRVLGEKESPLPRDWVVGQALNWIAELVLVKPWRQKLLQWKPGVEAQRGYTEPPSLIVKPSKATGSRRPPPRERSKFPKDAVVMGYEPAVTEVVEDAAHEAGVLALLSGMEHLLRPWFEDEAALNYAALRDFAHLPKHPFAGLPEEYPATHPMAAFQLRPSVVPEAASVPKDPVRRAGRTRQSERRT